MWGFCYYTCMMRNPWSMCPGRRQTVSPNHKVRMASSYLKHFDEQLLFLGGGGVCFVREVHGCVRLVLLSLCRRTPPGSNNAPPMRRDFHKLWQKSKLYHKNDAFSCKHSGKFCDAGKKSDKYHLLLMSLRTFGASLASTALRHCITIRWLSVGSATDGILRKTDFAFELLDIPDRKV